MELSNIEAEHDITIIPEPATHDQVTLTETILPLISASLSNPAYTGVWVCLELTGRNLSYPSLLVFRFEAILI